MSILFGKRVHKPPRTFETITLLVFVLLYSVISYFHEPWFDEAQAWQIARCASYKDILFVLTHYEGHPPLWWLILSLPAKLGIPFEIGLKSIGFIISVISAALIIFRSGLPKQVKLLLPFSFFFFYQYGIIVRPYGLMLLLLIIIGQEFHQRNTEPWLVVFLMILLCATSAYGIVISGGISLCIVWELICEKGIKRLFTELFHDRRTIALFTLLLFALFLIVLIFPREDTWVTSKDGANSPLLCLICTFLTFIGDCLITDSSWFRTDTVLLQNSYISILNLFSSSLFGVLIWIMIISIGSKKNIKFFVLPYILFAVFSAFVYVSAHHIGISMMILIFWLEVCAADKDTFEIGGKILSAISQTDSDKKMLKTAAYIFSSACLIIPVYWSISACIREIKLDYSYGRKAYSIIKQYNLEDCLILTSWGENSSKKYGEMIGHEDYLNTYENGNPVLICAYLDNNIFYNFGNGQDKEAYMHYRMADYETSIQTMKSWASEGSPDILIGKPKLEALFGKQLTMNDYSLVFAPEINYIWKNKEYKSYLPIFMRNDLLEKYHLEPLNDAKYIFINGLKVTEEMKKDYKNGVPIEEIIKPYMDAMFDDE